MNQQRDQLRSSREALVAELDARGHRPTGNKCRCPFHDDRHASATIHLDRDGAWRMHCHASCKKSWDVFDLRAAFKGTSAKVELKAVAGGRAGPDRQPKPRVYKTLEDMAESLAHGAGGDVESIFRYRTADNTGLAMAVVRIRTPDGKTFRQGRPQGDGWVAQAPKPAPLFALPDLAKADAVLVVEGEKAAVAAWSTLCDHRLGLGPTPDGLRWAVTTSPMGAGNGHHADWTPLSGKRLVVLWPDNDRADPKTGKRNGEAHMQAVGELLHRLADPPEEVRVIDPAKLGFTAAGGEPDGEDVVELLEQYAGRTQSERRDVLLAAVSIARPVDAANDLRQLLQDTSEGRNRNLRFGRHAQLTRLVRALQPETCTVIAGGEGSGKSLFVNDLALDWAVEGVRYAYLALEKRRDFHLERLLAQVSGRTEILDRQWQEENPAEVRKIWDAHRGLINKIAPSIHTPAIGEEVTYPWVLKWLNAAADTGPQILIVDPITKVLRDERSGHLEDHRFMMGVEQLLQRTRCRLILITHTVKGGMAGGRKAVGSDAVAGGAAFSRFADTLLLFNVLEAPRAVTVAGPTGPFRFRGRRFLKALKSRNGPGDKAEFAMFLDPKTLRFQEQGLVVHSKKQTPEGVVVPGESDEPSDEAEGAATGGGKEEEIQF